MVCEIRQVDSPWVDQAGDDLLVQRMHRFQEETLYPAILPPQMKFCSVAQTGLKFASAPPLRTWEIHLSGTVPFLQQGEDGCGYQAEFGVYLHGDELQLCPSLLSF